MKKKLKKFDWRRIDNRMKTRAFKCPDIKKANLDCLWFETKKGKRKVLTVEQARKGSIGPCPRKYPYAYSRFPLEVTTNLYQRRIKDGGYGTKDLMCSFHSTAPGDLAVALVVRSNYTISLSDALVICSTACERCMNILANQYGLSWGYSPTSEEAKNCGTSCELCR